MCVAEKCCYYIPLNIACVFLGVINFIIALCLSTWSLAIYFTNRGYMNMEGVTKEHLLTRFVGLELKVETLNIILSVVIIISVFWMLFSVLLVVGVFKNESSLILCFFSFGIILTILCQLSALLMLLNTHWWMAMIIFIASLVNIHFLVVVHTVYELMQKGTVFSFRRRAQDEDLLADCFDENLNA